MRAMAPGIVNGKQLTDEEEAFSEGALSGQHSVVSEKQNQQQQRPFTAKDTEDAKQEEKGLRW